VLSVDFFAPWFADLVVLPEWLRADRCGSSLSHAARTLQSLCRDLAFTPQQQTALSQAFEPSCSLRIPGSCTLCAPPLPMKIWKLHSLPADMKPRWA
jgi:hypothetical protein